MKERADRRLMEQVKALLADLPAEDRAEILAHLVALGSEAAAAPAAPSPDPPSTPGPKERWTRCGDSTCRCRLAPKSQKTGPPLHGPYAYSAVRRTRGGTHFRHKGRADRGIADGEDDSA